MKKQTSSEADILELVAAIGVVGLSLAIPHIGISILLFVGGGGWLIFGEVGRKSIRVSRLYRLWLVLGGLAIGSLEAASFIEIFTDSWLRYIAPLTFVVTGIALYLIWRFDLRKRLAVE